jgi:hypothetical protein
MTRSISANSRSRNNNGGNFASLLQLHNSSTGVFKGGTISSSATPINRKFAPAFYTTHSLVGNNMVLKSEISVKNNEK